MAAMATESFGGKRYQTQTIGESGYDDSYEDYLGFLRPRLKEAYRILCADGSLFFHIDWREAANCRLLLEEIFGGPQHCINEIIWAYDYGARSRRRWSAKHDNIYWFAKNPENYVFNHDAIDRIPYMAPSLVPKEKAARGKTPTDVWAPTGDYWWQTIVSTNGKEKTGYPTQKPAVIIKRIITTHSNTGDTVLDFFAGSGTVGEVAKETKRKFILIDNNDEAYSVMNRRLRKEEEGVIADNNGGKNKIFDEIVATLSEKKHKGQMWEGSIYQSLHMLSPGTKGKMARELVRKLLYRGWGYESKSQKTFLSVGGKIIAVKLSFLWEQGTYTFEQIRRKENYDYLFFLGISPFTAHAWIISKTDALNVATKQHGEDTKWLQIDPNDNERWQGEFKKQMWASWRFACKTYFF